MPDVLAVTARHVEDVTADGNDLATAILVPCSARRADGERDLIARATVVGWTAQDLARHLQEGRVVVERRARAAPQLAQRLPEEREGFTRDLEAKDMTPH